MVTSFFFSATSHTKLQAALSDTELYMWVRVELDKYTSIRYSTYSNRTINLNLNS